MEYKIENFENEDNRPLNDFFENPVLIRISELAKERWEVIAILPWKIEGLEEYLVLFKK